MKRLVLLAVAAAALVTATVALTAPSNGDELLKDEKHFLEQSNKTYTGGNKGGSARNMELVGHTSLGDRGFNADVSVYDGYAYVGSALRTDNGAETPLYFLVTPVTVFLTAPRSTRLCNFS